MVGVVVAYRLQIAKQRAQGHVLLVGQVNLGEEQHLVGPKRLPQLGRHPVVEVIGIQPLHCGSQCCRQRSHFDAHGSMFPEFSEKSIDGE